MKRRLLDFLCCPRCHGTLALEVFAENGGGEEGRDIESGALRCGACAAAFPIVAGVPRLLAPSLLARLRRRYPEFFASHRELAGNAAGDASPLADTLESFTRQRLDLGPPGPEAAPQWRANLARNLGSAIGVDALHGKLILDVGCGFGRHLYVASEAGAEIVGLDLSGGVDLAYRNNRSHPRCHVVQGSVFDLPLRPGAFDVVWSFGVLHHMPDPRAGFGAMVELAKPQGGLVAIWVYGYRDMAFSYRLSHMRSLHRWTREWSSAGRVRASKAVAGALSVLYWGPLRLAKRIGLAHAVDRLPLADYVDHGWLARVAGVHDRLSTPITHFHDREELLGWFRDAGLVDVRVEDTDRRGWRAHGERRATSTVQVPAGGPAPSTRFAD
jgi:SAM-dependent methyltransferase